MIIMIIIFQLRNGMISSAFLHLQSRVIHWDVKMAPISWGTCVQLEKQATPPVLHKFAYDPPTLYPSLFLSFQFQLKLNLHWLSSATASAIDAGAAGEVA